MPRKKETPLPDGEGRTSECFAGGTGFHEIIDESISPRQITGGVGSTTDRNSGLSYASQALFYRPTTWPGGDENPAIPDR